ncbi:MAG: hypothetical protein FD170_3710 [Bacteroidetes bacterium]|nr:MAG: hypothetical protein FD170_3710 [Bacteroidota bacterium]
MKSFLQKTKSLTALFAIIALLLMPSVGWGQYTGTGTFNKITSLTDLTDGYYVIVNSGDGFAMNNTNGGSYFEHTSITPSSNTITNPGASIVWKIENNGNGRSIFNEASSKYVSYTGSSNAAYAVDAVTSDAQRWTFTYAPDVFSVANLATSGRILQYNSSSPRFACYTTSQQRILLYKLVSTAIPDINVSNNGTQVSVANVNSGTTAHILHKSALAVTTANASLTGMTCVTAGTYAAADITNLKVRYSADANLDAGDATLSTLNNPGAAGSKTFPSFTSQSISSGNTGYIFITADIASTATHNNTININALTTSNFTFSSGNKTGSTDAGGAQTIKDVNTPGVSTYNPSDNASSVVITSNLVLTFNENVQKGTGNITIHKISDNSIVQTIDVQNQAVSISNNVVTINPADFAYGTRYYVNIPSGAIQDIAGNNYAGISNNSTWNFTTVAPSVTNVTSTNADGSYKIGDLLTITVSFNDIVTITGAPYILLNMVGTDREASYSAGSGTATLSFTHTVAAADDASDLDYVSTTSLALNGGTINSADGIVATRTLAAPGAAGSLGFNKNIVVDGVNPTVNTYSPSDGNTTVTLNQNLILTFSENVKAGTSGNVVIYNTGGTPFETIPYNDSRITFSNNTVTINPEGTFAFSSEYYVQITNNAITDIVGNPYTGISNSTTWNFTTVCEAITTFPYTQDFESGSLPLCWTQEFVVGNLGWQFLTGNGASNPANAKSGSFNACLKNSSFTADVSKLIMPVFDLSSISAPVLSFWHTQALYSPDQDELRVYYKTSSGGSWTLLATYTSDVPTWTRRQISLPNPGSTYFIAFEGTAKYGYGVCIDDITLGELIGEPQNHVSNLLSAAGTPAYNKIDLVWDDATGSPLPDGYLIKGSAVGFSSIDNPIDGTEEADGSLVKNVSYGVEFCNFSNLNPLTEYYFKVFPYTNSGSNINYKTNGEIPQTTAATTDGPCLTEAFDAGSLPTGWSQTNVTFTSNYADFSATTGSLAMTSLGNANAVSFTLTRTTNTNAKSMIVEVSTTSQSAGYTTVATYDHSNTTAGGTTNCTVDLSAFSSNSALFIRFRKASSTTSYWRLDAISVNCGELTIWKGTTNTVWETSTNWTNGTPTAVKSATIEDVSNDPILTTSIECNKLTINTGSILTVASVGALKVNGTLTNNAGISGLIIKSDATGTGSLIHNTAGVGATVERYITKYGAIGDQMFHLISSPVAAQAIRPEFVSNAATIPAGTDFYSFSESTNEWINTRAAGDIWNTAFEENFAIGKGYLVAYPSDVTKNFTGNLNSAQVVLTCSNTAPPAGGNGWNLLGNPFPSAIDWVALTRSAGLDNALYYYDNAEQKYRYYLSMPGDLTSIGSGSRYIPAMQGFMVHASTNGATLTIPTAAKTHTGQNIYYKSTATIPGSLSLKVATNGHEDEAFIHFNNQATTAFDGAFDAYKLRSYSTSVPNLFTKSSDGNDLAINGLPELGETTVIPVYFEAAAEGEHIMSANLTSMPGALVYLVDEKLNKTQNLNSNPVYTFNAVTGDNTNRFKLTFGSVSIDNPSTTSSISVYTHGETLYISGLNAKAEISVVNLTGQVVISSRSNGSGLHSVNAASLPKGVYVVSVISNGQAISRKVVL